MSTTVIGTRAEDITANHLKQLGYRIIDQKWKTQTCEIDIVAIKGRCVYFVEVKYRATRSNGDGFAYITPIKLKRMRYAADLWVVTHRWAGEYALSASSVSGSDYQIEFVDIIL